MKTFKIEIELGNDAMRTDSDIAHLLNKLAMDITLGRLRGVSDVGSLDTIKWYHSSVRDRNGNSVGWIHIGNDEDDCTEWEEGY